MALTAGDKSPKNVFLRYEGGYTQDHLVPAEGDGDTAPEGRGMLLVAKGDEVRPEHVALYDQAEKYAAKLAADADAEEAAAEAAAEEAEEEAAREREAQTQTAGDGSSPAEEPIDSAAAPSGPVPTDQAAVELQVGGDSTATSPAGDAQAEADEEPVAADSSSTVVAADEPAAAEEPAPAKKSTRRTAASS